MFEYLESELNKFKKTVSEISPKNIQRSLTIAASLIPALLVACMPYVGERDQAELKITSPQEGSPVAFFDRVSGIGFKLGRRVPWLLVRNLDLLSDRAYPKRIPSVDSYGFWEASDVRFGVDPDSSRGQRFQLMAALAEQDASDRLKAKLDRETKLNSFKGLSRTDWDDWTDLIEEPSTGRVRAVPIASADELQIYSATAVYRDPVR